MKNNSLFGVMFLIMVMVIGSYAILYGDTAVALQADDGTLYRQITNGRIGANCYDETGAKIIAPSRLFGPRWTEIGKLDKSGKTYSITCYPYSSLGNTEPVSASFRDS